MANREKTTYTDEEVVKLKLRDCEVLHNYTEWRQGWKFLRRGRATATVLVKMKEGGWLATCRRISDVKVDGIVLQYLSWYEFTNGKNPFKTIAKTEG